MVGFLLPTFSPCHMAAVFGLHTGLLDPIGLIQGRSTSSRAFTIVKRINTPYTRPLVVLYPLALSAWQPIRKYSENNAPVVLTRMPAVLSWTKTRGHTAWDSIFWLVVSSLICGTLTVSKFGISLEVKFRRTSTRSNPIHQPGVNPSHSGLPQNAISTLISMITRW